MQRGKKHESNFFQVFSAFFQVETSFLAFFKKQIVGSCFFDKNEQSSLNCNNIVRQGVCVACSASSGKNAERIGSSHCRASHLYLKAIAR